MVSKPPECSDRSAQGAAAGLGAPPIEGRSSAASHGPANGSAQRKKTGGAHGGWAYCHHDPPTGSPIDRFPTNSLNPYARQTALIGTTLKGLDEPFLPCWPCGAASDWAAEFWRVRCRERLHLFCQAPSAGGWGTTPIVNKQVEARQTSRKGTNWEPPDFHRGRDQPYYPVSILSFHRPKNSSVPGAKKIKNPGWKGSMKVSKRRIWAFQKP